MKQEVAEGRGSIIKTNMILNILDEDIIRKLKKLMDSFNFIRHLSQIVGAIHLQLSLIENSALPEKKSINKMILPSLNLMNRPLLGFLGNLCSKSLFLLNIIYEKEKKHPNFKIVDNLLKNSMFKPPKKDKQCFFFPTPKTDMIEFDSESSLPSCFIKSKKSTFALLEMKNIISESLAASLSMIYIIHHIKTVYLIL